MKIAIYGYGNLGRGVECATKYHTDAELVGVFTRRPPETLKTLFDTPVYSVDSILDFKDKIDVLIICGGSATDLPKMTPALAENFNVVDSFDTHAKIPEHFRAVDGGASLRIKRSALGLRLHILGQGNKPGPFGCHKKNTRSA